MTSGAAPADASPWPGWPSALGGIARRLRTALGHVARAAPARVFIIEGIGPPGSVEELRLADGVRLVETPRSATVLLVAGRLPESLHDAARRTHDAMAHPRAVVWWMIDTGQGTAAPAPAPFSSALVVCSKETAAGTADVTALAAQLHATQVALVDGERQSSPPLLSDVDPAPWRGVGPFGQGGSGMTGGVPYGRPLTGRAPDRDGLELDQLPLRVGPFFAPFPPGLVLDVKLQGDIVQEAVVPGNAFAGIPGGPSVPDPFATALTTPVPIAELERARARHHLRWLAHALRFHGLDALSLRPLSFAAALRGALHADSLRAAAGEVAALGRLLERSRALGWATAAVGVTAPEAVRGWGLGPVARAAGLVEDARLSDPEYQALGFEPVGGGPHGASRGDAVGDARARWRQRLAEAVQSLELAARAGSQRTGGAGVSIEGPRGTLSSDTGTSGPSATLLVLLPELLRGQEWGDAVTTVVSLDLDIREAAPGAAPLAPPPVPNPSSGMGGMGMKGMSQIGEMSKRPKGDEQKRSDEHHGHGGSS